MKTITTTIVALLLVVSSETVEVPIDDRRHPHFVGH